jgi:hypothetical protein
MKTILGDNDSKLTLGKDGATFKIPSDMLLGGDVAGADAKTGIPAPSALNTDANVSTMAPAQAQSQPAALPTPPTRVNPFASIGAAELAGLDAKDILGLTDVLQRRQQMEQMTYRDAVNAMSDVPYKQALTKQAEAATAENTPSVPIQVGNRSMMVTPKDAIAWARIQKEMTPAKIKEYEYAQSQGYSGSIVDFSNLEKTVDIKNFEKAKKDGYQGNFNTWLTTQNQAKAINLGTKIEEKKALSELAGQLYFNDPKWTDDIHKQVLDFDKNQSWLIPEKDRPLAKSKVIVKSIEDKIVAGGGNIQKVVMDKDGKTMVWTVKWPSNDIKTIKQAVK